MKLFKHAETLQQYLSSEKIAVNAIGFVPTMGALHSGHISLINLSKSKCELTICSIFVNPTQFNDKKDFDNYPITIAADVKLLEEAGCDILFYPSAHEIYPAGITDLLHYDLGTIESVLEGEYRPGHYQGVCQVVHRLLDIVKPTMLFLGQKDFQQCMVLQRLITITKSTTQIVIGPTLREISGLAMSSRNQRLTSEQTAAATAIFKMLLFIKEKYATTKATEGLSEKAGSYLLENGFNKVDYVAIVDQHTLQPISSASQKAVVLIAAFIGDVRLIDNMLLD